MNGFTAVVRREIGIRRTVFAAAAVAGIAALGAPLAHGLRGPAADDATGAVGLLLAVAFAFGLSIALGAWSAASAIASRRIAFDFGRPLSAPAIWGGRLVAATVLAATSAALALFPAVATGGRVSLGDLVVDADLGRRWPLLAVVAIVTTFAAAHAVSVMLQSRSALAAADAVLAVAAALGFFAVASRLPSYLAPAPHARVVWGFAAACVAALLAAGLAGTAHGRTDIRAAHRATSLVLWACVGTALAVAAGYASWIGRASPPDLHGFWATPAAAGPWVALDGQAREARARFLYDAASGRFVRAYAVGPSSPAISRDGRVAAWVEGGFGEDPHEIVRLSLGSPESVPTRTRLFVEGQPWLFVLSPDGARLAVLDANGLSIHDLAAGRTLVSVRTPPADDVRGFFVEPERFRMYLQKGARTSPATFEVAEVDVRAKRLRRGEARELPRAPLYLVVDAPGERAVTVDNPGKRVQLLDGATGAVRATLIEGGSDSIRSPGFLANGRIVVAESSTGGSKLRLFDASGAAEGELPLPGRTLIVGGEISPGRLLVGVGAGDGTSYSVQIVDLGAGTVRKVADEAYPAARLGGFGLVPNAAPAPGGDATRLIIRHGNELARVEGDGGTVRVLLRTRPVR